MTWGQIWYLLWDWGLNRLKRALWIDRQDVFSDRLLNRQLLIKAFVWYGLIEAALAMGAFFLKFIWVNQGNFKPFWPAQVLFYREATTMTLGAIIFTQLVWL